MPKAKHKKTGSNHDGDREHKLRFSLQPIVVVGLVLLSLFHMCRETRSIQFLEPFVAGTLASLVTEYLGESDHRDDDLEPAVCIYSKDIGSVVKLNREIPPFIVHEAACRILIRNFPDFHYELLESVMLKYPLPWDDLDCNFSKSNLVIFDLGLSDKAVHVLTEELDDYMDYWRTFVQGTVRQRMVAESRRKTHNNSHRNMNNGYEDVRAFAGHVDSFLSKDMEKLTFAAKIEVSCGSVDGNRWIK